MKKIDGKAIARNIIDELKKQPRPSKKLVAVLVGVDAASQAFLRQKEKTANELGIEFQLHQLSETDAEDEIEERVRTLSSDAAVGGIIVQLPLPRRFNANAVIKAIDPKKDVDALTAYPLVEAPAVGVVKEILRETGFKIQDSRIAVIGKGFLVGQPIIAWLKSQIPNPKFQLKIADIETENLEDFIKDADLVISGVGKEGLIKPEWLKNGAGIIDFGYPADFNRGTSQDPRSSDVQELNRLSFYTPTPGGTGPILVAKLFENFYALN